MKLQTKLVAVKRVNPTITKSGFSEERIEKLAKLIIDSEGIINPIILKRTSLESYEVIHGHFEYYAAVRAREISLLKGEMIQAIILEPENEENLLEQISLLREAGDPQPENNGDSDKLVPVELISLFHAQFMDIKKAIAELDKKVDGLSNKLKLVDELTEELTAIKTVVVQKFSEEIDKSPDYHEDPRYNELNDINLSPLRKILSKLAKANNRIKGYSNLKKEDLLNFIFEKELVNLVLENR